MRELSGPEGVSAVWFSAPGAPGRVPGLRAWTDSFPYPPSLGFHGKQSREEKNQSGLTPDSVSYCADFKVGESGGLRLTARQWCRGEIIPSLRASLSPPVVTTGGMTGPGPVLRDESSVLESRPSSWAWCPGPRATEMAVRLWAALPHTRPPCVFLPQVLALALFPRQSRNFSRFSV